jgi:hypothetical protein
MALENFEEAFALMTESPKKVGKIVLFPDKSLLNGRLN